MQIPPEEVQRLVRAYLEGAFSPAEKAAFERLLALSPALKREVQLGRSERIAWRGISQYFQLENNPTAPGKGWLTSLLGTAWVVGSFTARSRDSVIETDGQASEDDIRMGLPQEAKDDPQ